MHRAIALLCLSPALGEVRIDRADPRICLAPRLALELLVAAPPRSRPSRPPSPDQPAARRPRPPGRAGLSAPPVGMRPAFASRAGGRG